MYSICDIHFSFLLFFCLAAYENQSGVTRGCQQPKWPNHAFSLTNSNKCTIKYAIPSRNSSNPYIINNNHHNNEIGSITISVSSSPV